VVGLLGDAVGAAGVGDSLARLDALEDVDDLLFAEPGLAHDEFSSVGYITGKLSSSLHLFPGRRSPGLAGLRSRFASSFSLRRFKHICT
jgi:hypothetical protein